MKSVGMHDLETGEAAGNLLLATAPTLSVLPRLLLLTRHPRGSWTR
jgi:hypothetical protein